jgi:hypothetical protein
MTKFIKFGKIGSSDFLFWIVRFRQFQKKAKERAKLEDLKMQDILKHGERLKSIKGVR